MVSREDMLRELELLPVWRLRVPTTVKPVAESVSPIPFSETEIKPIEDLAAATAVLMVSEDKKWVFALPAILTEQSADLFHNILRALKIRSTQTAHTQKLTQDIATSGASVVVVMGEITAQLLLTSTQSIERLRGKLHSVNGVQVVVTYHPDDLLQDLPNKAQTWDDLCMALSIVSA